MRYLKLAFDYLVLVFGMGMSAFFIFSMCVFAYLFTRDFLRWLAFSE